jgi:ADP-heptose:LPS heptosyltransferase
MAGKWSIRQSMSFAEVSDLIIGTETGLLNAAGYLDAAKIVTLSHSSEEMLTKHWKNAIALNQPAGVGCIKHPCRQLHGASGTSPWMECPAHEDDQMKVALCQYHVTADMMWGAVRQVLGAERMVA